MKQTQGSKFEESH